MNERMNTARKAQYKEWLDAVSPAVLAQVVAYRSSRDTNGIGQKLDRLLLSLYRPTHCDCCGQPFDAPAFVLWDGDRPRAECESCYRAMSM